ncbi:N2,N2-dimethylguanosine tRNA methyltransferase [Caldisphaera lagunensis DSM 15908]|uniref:tRNA (guanine(26)-N(2))-dimethyltransferase n=1 Tax=Caldisphaera lagunensis (strain DSM 15908 / JCM 11604 / ANMR 0165 / IC-154) TaxID=1056495 RepID=L0ABV0_CALLD|nr:tRNA (guanine(26)-N(2))-dimethyltransferase [Caldisphaera lagunensis]AFZ70909.1 N2,N2-dimethylguanosine tRNA methyltransferase [Caldisphaera lagunensis DSM 15908]
MRLSVIKEGKALIYIPDTRDAQISKGIIEPSHLDVFYNPVMEFNRDLSVLAVSTFIESYWPGKEVIGIDPLSATGIRGIRYSLEINSMSKVIINDIDKDAYDIMVKNVELNGVKNVDVYNKDANSLMRSIRFEQNQIINIIDLDPFGSILPFIDTAISVSSKGTLLALTATDLAVLGGSKYIAAKRKYRVNLISIKHYREIALRVLLAFIAYVAASYDKVIKPLIAYSVDHYARVYLLIDRGTKKSEEMLNKNIGYYKYENGILMKCDNNCYGPIWNGNISDIEFLKSINDKLKDFSYVETYQRMDKFVKMYLNEMEFSNYYHQRLDTICQSQKINMPSIIKFISALENKGYKAFRSTFSNVGFRSNAPYDVLIETCREFKSS